MNANVYLNFNGKCEEAFRFYAKVCNGSVEAMMTQENAPPSAQMPEMRNKIMHARVKLGETTILGADSPSAHFRKADGFSVCLSVDSVSEAERIFKAFSEGGEVRMPLEETFFAEKFGMCVDRFGTPWMVIRERAM